MKELDTVNNEIEFMDLQPFTVYEIRVNFIVFYEFFCTLPDSFGDHC